MYENSCLPTYVYLMACVKHPGRCRCANSRQAISTPLELGGLDEIAKMVPNHPAANDVSNGPWSKRRKVSHLERDVLNFDTKVKN